MVIHQRCECESLECGHQQGALSRQCVADATVESSYKDAIAGGRGAYLCAQCADFHMAESLLNRTVESGPMIGDPAGSSVDRTSAPTGVDRPEAETAGSNPARPTVLPSQRDCEHKQWIGPYSDDGPGIWMECKECGKLREVGDQ